MGSRKKVTTLQHIHLPVKTNRKLQALIGNVFSIRSTLQGDISLLVLIRSNDRCSYSFIVVKEPDSVKRKAEEIIIAQMIDSGYTSYKDFKDVCKKYGVKDLGIKIDQLVMMPNATTKVLYGL